MRNKYILLFTAWLACSLNVLGQQLCKENISASGSSIENIPGLTSIKKIWNEGEKYESKFEIPVKKYRHDTYILENEKGSINNGTIYSEESFKNSTLFFRRPTIIGEGQHTSGSNRYLHSIQFKSLSLTESIEWSCNRYIWHCADSNIKSAINTKEENSIGYNRTYEFPGLGYYIDTKLLWEEVQNNEKAKEIYKTNGKIQIFFRYVYYIELNAQQNDHNERDESIKGYFYQDQECSVVIKSCEVGDLKVKGDYVSQSENYYAIYEKETNPIEIESYVSHSEDEAVKDSIVGIKEIETDKQDHEFCGGKHIVNHEIAIVNFHRGTNGLDPGDIYQLRRYVTVDGQFSCNKDINFMIYPEPKLDGISAEEREVVVCETEKEYSSYENVEYMVDGSFQQLKGNKCSYIDKNGKEYKEEVYGTEYRWSYSTDKNSNYILLPIKEGNEEIGNSLFDYNRDKNGPDLYLPIFMLDPERTYYFKQKVVFNKFGGKSIEATVEKNSGMVKEYIVRVSKSLDKGKLSVEITPNEACYGENLENVEFHAKYEDSENFKLYGVKDVNGFKYSWYIDEEEEPNESYKEVSFFKDYSSLKEKHCLKVSMSDGCANTIEKKVCLEVYDLPEFSAENIICESSEISMSYETDPVSKQLYVLVSGRKGKQFDLKVSDEEKSSFDYYSSDGGDSQLNKIFPSYKGAIADKEFYLYKQGKNGFKCLSNPVKVVVKVLEEIQGNEFGMDEIYVCHGSNVPELNSTNISDPIMGGATFAYAWQYSSNGVDWKDMVNTSDKGTETKFTEKNYDGTWDYKVSSDAVVYIRRVVTALLNGVEVGTHMSKALAVSTYADPAPTLTLTSDNTKATKCYGEVVNLSMAVNQTLLDQQKTMQQSNISTYGYYNFDGKNYYPIQAYTQINGYDLELQGNYSLYSGVNFCGSMVYSKEGVSVATYPAMDVNPIVSKCKIVGQEVTIKASDEDFDCSISGSSITYPDETDKSRATILLEKKQIYTYLVDIENTKTGCKSQVKKMIHDTEILDKLAPKEIGPNGNKNEKVCAGTEITLNSTNVSENMSDYNWSVNGVYIKEGNNDKARYTFPEPGTDYKVAREWSYYNGTEKCYSVIDEVTVSTYPKVETPALEVSKSKICNGEDISLTATAVGGGSSTSYSFTLMPGDVVSSEKVSKSKSVNFDVSGLKASTSYYVIAEDNNCPANENYKTQSEKVSVEVEKDLSFTITSTKSVITRDEFKDGVISVPVTIVGALPNETLYYTLGDDKVETKVVYPATGVLSIKMDESLFETNNTKLYVRREGTVLPTCTSDAIKIFGVNDGFVGVPDLVGNEIDQEIEVCGGTDVELSVANFGLMTFDSEKITSMTDNQWTWFKDNSVVAKTTDAEYTATASAGKTNVYTVVFSAKDSDGTTRKVSSNEFVVKGSEGIEVGRIAFGGDYSSQNFVEFCNNSDSKKKISMTCELDPDIVDFSWKYSLTGAVGSFKDVPDTWNGMVSTKSSVITINVDSLVKNGGETYYFQVEARDNCDNVTLSKSRNMLQVKVKKNIELPVVTMTSTKIYSSAELLPASLEFNRKSTHTTLYEFVGWGESEDLGGTSQRVNVKDLRFGVNSVDVVRTELAKISNEECVSDTLHYTFNIYKRLATPKLGATDVEITCPNNKTPKYMTLNNISGGDTSSYKVTWQYKLNEDADWYMMEAGDNQGLFTVAFGKVMPNLGSYLQSIEITNQSKSIKVRALVSCDNDKYPGDYVVSNEMAMEVYAPLKDNGIDYMSKEICFNTAVDTIMGYPAEGGSGRYSYTWWSSEDNELFEQVVKGEENEPFFAPRNFGGTYNLKRTTYFKRQVADKVCNTSVESEIVTVYVRDSFEIKYPDDFEYSTIVSNNNRAQFTGTTEGYEYVWWETETKEFKNGNTKYAKPFETEALVVPSGDDFRMVTYYAQAIKDGCRSMNKASMEIYVYNQTGGEIYFDGVESKTDAFWICSGAKDIEVLSNDNVQNVKYSWYYIAGSESKPIRGKNSSIVVTTPEINLDTTNLSLSNNTGGKSSVKIFRLAKVSIGGKEETLSSDTLTINIVPTLQSVSNAKEAEFGEPLAGTLYIDGDLRTKSKEYCIGEEPDYITGKVKEDLYEFWYNYKSNFGPWIYDRNVGGGFTTYIKYKKDGGEWIKENEIDFSEDNDYAAKSYGIPTSSISIDGSYSVIRVIDDGCSTVESNQVNLGMMDAVVNPDTIVTKAYMPTSTADKFDERNPIGQGFEIGDSIVFESMDRSLSLVFFSDVLCSDTLQGGRRYCSLVLDEELASMMSTEGAYIYAKVKEDECYGEAVEIPFAYGTKSDGGRIGIIDTVICQNDLYSNIVNIKPASGYYIAPENVAMKWTYTWQFKRSFSEKAVWSTIEGADEEGLSADIINGLVEMAVSETDPLIIRRVAKNEKGRVRYSNVITLDHFPKLVAGELSLSDGIGKYCTYDELGYVKATDSQGGSSGIKRSKMFYNINGNPWTEINYVDSLYLGNIEYELEDRSRNNYVNIKCVYYDRCDTVESKTIEVVFYRGNKRPEIYQNSDSCDAKTVNLIAYKEDVKKSYIWEGYYKDPNDTTSIVKKTGFYSDKDSVLIFRYSNLLGVYYGIKSMDEETGCESEYYYFSVDSLPELSQTQPLAPLAICSGSDLEIKGGSLSGGNGEKEYQWQISSTGNENDFSELVDGNGEDLKVASRYMRMPAYFRRIVTDMCYSDTSSIVKVDVRDNVRVSADDLSFNDFKCPNGVFSAKVVADKDSSMMSEFWTLESDTIYAPGRNVQMEGFAEDSMEYVFTHYLTDSTGLTCKSEGISVIAYNKPTIERDMNRITAENYKPCNESEVRITGEVLGGSHPDQVKYLWYLNGVEQVGEFDSWISLTANDDMEIVRIADNGCVKDSSNTLHIEGQLVYAYDYGFGLGMEVVSDSKDSSVVINIQGAKSFSDGYEFQGDGEMPNVLSNNIVLPYKYDTYKDSMLGIVAKVPYCVRPLSVRPLRGGVISFDGDVELCGGEEVAPIVVSELEGGNGTATYQWQYRNERTPGFVNIPDATEKTYTPSSVDVATTYRRIAVDGFYKSVSNELTLTIKPLPAVALVDNSYSSKELLSLSLLYKKHSYYQWVDNMKMYLIDSSRYSEHTRWQISYDQLVWNDKAIDSDSILIDDPSEVAYYRYIAENACGADTSTAVRMEKRLIEPIEDEQIYWRMTDTFVCRNEQDEEYLRFNMVGEGYAPGFVNRKYKYSYKVGSSCDAFVWKSLVRKIESGYERFDSIFTDTTLMSFASEIRISEYDENGKKRIPSDNVTLYVTRHDTVRGISTTRAVEMKVNTFDATYSMVVENGEEVYVGEKRTIILKQGDRVKFIPKVTSNVEYSDGDVRYEWRLEKPLNEEFFSRYGGGNGKDGVTSERESPSCYYYNGGRYPVALTVTDGVCKKSVRDTSLYIPEYTVKNYKISLALDDSLRIEENERLVEIIDVSPTYVTDVVTVSSTNKEKHQVVLVDEIGRILLITDFAGSVDLDMEACQSGAYFIIVDGNESFKVIKR